jgi:hypothetical protein
MVTLVVAIGFQAQLRTRLPRRPPHIVFEVHDGMEIMQWEDFVQPPAGSGGFALERVHAAQL